MEIYVVHNALTMIKMMLHTRLFCC